MSGLLNFLGLGGSDKSDEEPKKKSSIVFSKLFRNYPDPDPTQPTQFSGPYLDRILKCCFLSHVVYSDPDKRVIPPEYGTVLFEEKLSAKYFVPYFIVNSDQENRIYIACRGSCCAEDFAVDTQAMAVAWKGGYVHRGVFQTAVHLYSSLRLYIQDVSMRCGKRPVTVTGHSLGGGVAGLVAEMFREEFPWMDVTAIVFAPCATISRDLWERSKSYIQSIILEGDFVPFLTFQNCQTLLDSWPKLMKSVIMASLTKAMLKSHSRPEGHPIQAKVPPHLNAILDEPPIKKSHEIPVFPPGDHYLLVCVEVPNQDGTKKRMVQVRKIASCDYFRHFVNNLNEFAHAIAGYEQWLTAYKKGGELAPGPWSDSGARAHVAPHVPPAYTPPVQYPPQYGYPQQPPVYPNQMPAYPQQPLPVQPPVYGQRPAYPQQPPYGQPPVYGQPPAYPNHQQQKAPAHSQPQHVNHQQVAYPQVPSYPQQQAPVYPQAPYPPPRF